MPDTNTVSEIITNERLRLLNKKKKVDANLETQSRLMMLQDSNRKRTTRYTAIMAYLVFGVLAYVFLEFLGGMFVAIPGMVFTILKLVVIGVTVYAILTAYTDIATRSTGNFDEIDVPPIIDLSGNGVGLKLSETESTPSNAGNVGQFLDGQCRGETCCATGTNWDPKISQCVKDETFTTMDTLDVQGVYLNSIKANLDGVAGNFVSSGEKYVRPEMINVSLGSIA